MRNSAYINDRQTVNLSPPPSQHLLIYIEKNIDISENQIIRPVVCETG